MIYAAGAALLLIALSGGWAWVQGVRLDAVKAKLERCAAQYDLALKSIKKQNEAIKGLEDASKTAQDRSRRELEAAAGGRVAAESEAKRLKAELGKKPVTGCPAAEGVKVVRDGLK